MATEMATNGLEQSNLSLPKSPRSPRQLPALPRPPQTPVIEQDSLGHGQSLVKSPGTPLVFEFPPECYPETPNTNFDFDEFGHAGNSEHEQQRSARSPRSPGYYARASPRSPKTPNSEMLHSPGNKSPTFQFCELRKSPMHTMNYSTPTNDWDRSVSSSGYGQRSPKPFDRRRNSCFGLVSMKNSPIMSPTIVMSSTDDATSPQTGRNSDMSAHYRNIAGYKSKGTSKTSSLDDSFSTLQERIVEETGERPRGVRIDRHLNKSQGCLDEAGRGHRKKSDGRSRHWKGEKNMSRRSTSDLTDMGEVSTEITLLSSPRRRGSMKGGLAYLASRRNSRDSQCFSGSNEEVGPLNFNGHPRSQQRRNFLELPVPRHLKPRSSSLPGNSYNPRDNDDLYRLREFNITHKGVINKGDSIISRGSRSNTPANSSRNSNVSGERSPFEGSCCSGQGASSDSDAEEISKYRVVLLGDSGVGKTALVSQCMTSEYINTYDASLDDEFGEKTVSVLLDGQESDMVFIDHPYVEMSVENSLSTYEPHACIVVYSIVSRMSFQVAEEILNYLWRENYTQERSVIVVGNKSDLARSRIILTNEGKQLATSRECKFIETSSGMKHNVDELLVGVLKQIRLRQSRDKKLLRQGSKGKQLSKLHNNKTVLSLNLAREILNKICLNDGKSKSCENLHVL